MSARITLTFCISAFFWYIPGEASVRRDVSTTQPLQLLNALNENVDQFRECIDQSLAKTVGQLNEKQLQPLFMAISDHLGRVSKAFDDLTAPRSTERQPAA